MGKEKEKWKRNKWDALILHSKQASLTELLGEQKLED